MSWSSPRTWVASEKITAAIMNAHVRDNLTALYAAIGPTSVPGMMTQHIYCTLGGSDGHRPIISGVANEAWHLCNGDANIDGSGITAPDWRDKFIVGAGVTYAQSATGGANTKNVAHTHTEGSIAAAAAAIPNHAHAISGDTGITAAAAAVKATASAAAVSVDHYHTLASTNTGNPTGSPTHTHTVAGSTVSGGSATQTIMPPYCALYGFVFVGV